MSKEDNHTRIKRYYDFIISSQQDSTKGAFLCYKEISEDSTIIIGRIGSSERVIMRLTSRGGSYFKDSYNATIRCQQIVEKINRSISLGATGWKAGTRNGYPIICAAKSHRDNSECLKDEDGPIVVATFKRGVDPTKMLAALQDIGEGTASSRPVLSF